MNAQIQAAQTPPSTRAWRFRRFFVVRFREVCWFLKLLFLRLTYRHIMRLSHYFGWHYAPVRHGPGGESYRWCQWCGLRGAVFDFSKGPLKIEKPSGMNWERSKE